jgi:hypothetical protein
MGGAIRIRDARQLPGRVPAKTVGFLAEKERRLNPQQRDPAVELYRQKRYPIPEIWFIRGKRAPSPEP